ncbi:hypothetical protein [Brachyspira hampsonii]|uniref:hypothetical protein n=1 Tax=Brachyspira hampsonii TaxID=1287055 RepID=UPI000D347857|nr:hypothetical protein [Brachyspira hampsonii]PTY41502.1 hypothetical protein DQ06_00075 [Brachyspira hampsonii bv. II]
MRTFTLDSITKIILEKTNFSKTSAKAIANYISCTIEEDCFTLEEGFFSRIYDEGKKEFIVDLDIQAILNVFKEFNTKQFVDFIKDKENKFDINKIMLKDTNYILYRMY